MLQFQMFTNCLLFIRKRTEEANVSQGLVYYEYLVCMSIMFANSLCQEPSLLKLRRLGGGTRMILRTPSCEPLSMSNA